MQIDLSTYTSDQLLNVYSPFLANWLTTAVNNPEYRKTNPAGHIQEEVVKEIRTQFLAKPDAKREDIEREELKCKILLSANMNFPRAVLNDLISKMISDLEDRFNLASDF